MTFLFEFQNSENLKYWLEKSHKRNQIIDID